MRTLPTLGICGWLVAAAALPTLSALESISGGIAQAQQLSPSDAGRQNVLQDEPLNLLQKEPLFPSPEVLGGELERSSPLARDPLSGSWLSRGPVSYLWSLPPGRDIDTSPGKKWPGGDYWKPGEFNRLIGPR
jgi:hypothetical protein